MAISKSRKEALVKQYQELLGQSKAIIMTSYAGLTVQEFEGLRRNIREVGGEFHVVKNTLVKLAFEGAGVPMPVKVLDGPSAIGFTSDDIPGLAKAIVDLAKDSDCVEVRGGLVEGVVYDASQFERLAELPPLPVVRAQFAGMLQIPAAHMARVVAGSVRQLVNVLQAYSEAEAADAAPA